jgi:hypothetical protein
MSSAKLFRLSGSFLLLAAAILLVASVLTLLFLPDTSATAPLSVIKGPFWPLNSSLNFLFSILLLLGLLGLYLRQVGHRGDVLALIGSIVLALGQCLEMGTAAFFIAIMPLLANKAAAIIPDAFSSSLVAFGLGAVLCDFLGPLLLGIALLRTRVFPRLVGVLFIVVAACIPLEIVFSSGFASTLSAAFTHTIAAIAFAWVGVLLTRQQQAVRADLSTPVETVVR